VPEHPVISVDGAWDAPGLNLSHWPGNRTPIALRHDLSTGSALAFSRLSAAERARLAGDAVAIVNNHYDTDGVMALFAVRHPEAALARADAMLDAARAGDFFQIPSELGLALDAVVTGLNDAERSPIRAAFAGLDEAGRREVVLAHLLEHLPALLDGDLGPYRELSDPVVERARADLSDLEDAAREDLPALDLATFRARDAWRSGGPGRHALFASTERDRVLTIDGADGGHRYRLVVSTLSWFDLARKRSPRPDLHALRRRLDELEGTTADDAAAWRTQDPGGPSPELWYGAPEVAPYAEHTDALSPSRLAPEEVRRVVEAHLSPSSPSSSPA
jgi:hypothetical protein